MAAASNFLSRLCGDGLLIILLCVVSLSQIVGWKIVCHSPPVALPFWLTLTLVEFLGIFCFVLFCQGHLYRLCWNLSRAQAYSTRDFGFSSHSKESPTLTQRWE